MVAVSEEDVKQEEIIQEDFKKAEEIMRRILKKFPYTQQGTMPEILFTLCLIYVRQLKLKWMQNQ